MIAAEILHVDIAGPLKTLQVAEVECLIIFWWKDYPVGQLRQSGDPGRSIALKPLVESSWIQRSCDRPASGRTGTVANCTG